MARSISRVRTPGLHRSRQICSASATTLPASRISPSSRVDFSSGALWNRERSTVDFASDCRLRVSRSPGRAAKPHAGNVRSSFYLVRLQRGDDIVVNRLDIADARHLDQEAALAVVLDQLVVEAVEDLKPAPLGFRFVVLALHQRRAAVVAGL